MEITEYRRLASVEDSHWWYQSIHRLIIATCNNLRKKIPRAEVMKVLDAGCGTGGLTEKLTSVSRVIGLDISPLALSFVDRKVTSIVEGTVNKLPFANESFHIVTSISVLYHRWVNEGKTLKEISRILMPKGFVVIVLPAFSWLWGNHDDRVYTARRYTRPEVEKLLKKHHFALLESRYLCSFIFPLFLAKRLMERFIPGLAAISDIEIPPRGINTLLQWICQVEWRVGKHLQIPWGSSLLIIAQK